MIERRIVRRYVAALFSTASSQGLVDRLESDLGLLSYAIESSPALMEAVSSPIIPASRKREIVDAIFSDKVHELTMSYIYLLIDQGREEAMGQTEEEFLRLANEARGIISAQVTTAVKLTEEDEVRVKAKLDSITGKSVHLEKTIDPEIVGGVVVRIGDRVIDGSVRGRLAALKEKLLS